MDIIKKRILSITLLLLLIVMAFTKVSDREKLSLMQNSIDTLERDLSQKQEEYQKLQTQLQEQNRTLQSVLSEKAKAEAFIEKLTQELEGRRSIFPIPSESNETKNLPKKNNSRGIRG